MSRHRLPLPAMVMQILREHRRAGILRWRCVRCGQSWRCRSRAWAEDFRREIKKGRRPRVTSLPIGHGTDASCEVSDAMALQPETQAAHAAETVSCVRPARGVLPHHGKAKGAHTL